MSLWNKLLKIFSGQPSIEPARKQSIDGSSSPTATSPPSSTSDELVDSFGEPLDPPNPSSSPTTGNNKPKAKPKSVGKSNGISDQHIKQLKEKYRPDASPDRSSSSSSSSDGEAKARRPKKKHKMNSSRSVCSYFFTPSHSCISIADGIIPSAMHKISLLYDQLSIT